MLSEFYEFGGTLFRIDSEEPLLESKYTAPFACAGTKTPDFVITVGYSGEKMQNGFSNANRSGSSVRIEFAKSYRGKISAKNALEESGIFRMLAEHGGVVLHSSYIITQRGEALLFSAPSGTGKSTQAELWRSYAGAKVINGDRALVKAENGVTANGILFSGTSGISENVTAPLRAIVLLRQSEKNEIRSVSGKEAFMRLLPQCSYYPDEEENLRIVTGILAEIISAVPVYDFGCVPDESAVSALSEVLYGK